LPIILRDLTTRATASAPLSALVCGSEGNVGLVHRITANDVTGHKTSLVREERRRVNATGAVCSGSALLDANLEVKMVIASSVVASRVTRLADALAGVLEASVRLAHVAVEDEVITAVLDHTLRAGGHGVAATSVGRGGDVSRACGGDILAPAEAEIEAIVHAACCGVPGSAVVPGEGSTTIRLPEPNALVAVSKNGGLADTAGGGGATGATTTAGWRGNIWWGRRASAISALQPVGGSPASLTIVANLEPVIVSVTDWTTDLGDLIPIVQIFLAADTTTESPSACAEGQGVGGHSVALAKRCTGTRQ
jgi:hypothetical protein